MTIITSLKGWHWLAIALVIGLAHGAIRDAARSATTDPLDQYETLITDPREFERALVEQVGGRPRFKDLIVHPYRRPGGKSAHLVTGTYFDGRPEWRDGQEIARWRPACYVAPTPYRPAAGDREYPSVLDYLRDLHGVQYREARFTWATAPMVTSAAGSALLIGLLLPTLINLLTFGSIFRPRETKGISLWKASAPSPRPALAPVAATVPTDASHSIDDDVEAAMNDPAATAASPSRALESAPLQPTAAAIAEAKHFGAKREDFYPTELRPVERD